MKIALLSDVHGNLPAFQAVVEDIGRTGVDETWCLGDLVGYGAQPDECVALATETCDACLIGNHDLVVLDRLPIEDFSADAAAAARWTRDRIGSQAVEFLSGLEPKDESREIALYHASPRDPVWEYVLSAGVAEAGIDGMDARRGAIGHSHVALWFRRHDGEMSGEPARGGAEVAIGEGEWLINPGAVGQPRDGDPRAAWLLVDTAGWNASWRRVEYPIEQAAQKIEEAGLPGTLADRLYYGQ